MKEKNKHMGARFNERQGKRKQGSDKASESRAESLSEKAKESEKNAWEVTKDTTQKIKETVVGKGYYKFDKLYFTSQVGLFSTCLFTRGSFET